MGLGRAILVLGVSGLVLGACVAPRLGRPVFPGYEEAGEASWYGEPYHGQRTAAGEIYDMHAATAAHGWLPFGTWVQVENLRNGQTVDVRINDRGPFVSGRIVDLSYAAARVLGMLRDGVVPVRLRVLRLPAD